MLKISPFCIILTLAFLNHSANAQYTQMIVDDSNRIMPIFFHDTPNHQTRNFQTNAITPQIQNPTPLAPIPIPSALTQASIVPTLKQPSILPNPLKGPYFISPERHRIMATAHAALGIPYIYGGNNPARGLDCSSLMQFIHRNALGVSIPRTAAQQRDHSKTIGFQNLQPGDMLFFKIDQRSNHVGIYIGHGKFIHASSSNRRASIASMHLPYWQKRFVKFGSYLRS